MSVDYVKTLSEPLTITGVEVREFDDESGNRVSKAVLVWAGDHPPLIINTTNARYLGRMFKGTADCIGAIVTLGTKVFSIVDRDSKARHEQEGIVIIDVTPPETGDAVPEPEPEPVPSVPTRGNRSRGGSLGPAPVPPVTRRVPPGRALDTRTGETA